MLGFPTHIVGTPGKGDRDAEGAPPQFGGPFDFAQDKKPLRGSGQAGATRAVEKIEIDQLLVRRGGPGVAWRGVAWRGVAWRGVVWCTKRREISLCAGRRIRREKSL